MYLQELAREWHPKEHGQGRRRTKKVHSWDPQTEDWTLNAEYLFLYDQWNLIHETITDHTQAPTEETTKSYVWGLDIAEQSGAGLPRHSSPGATAGGVGGLLSATTHDPSPTTHFVCYDGNGNVVTLVDSSDATIAAEYDYSPFGTTVKDTGSAAGDNAWRFSTKYHDVETSLVYYGYRHYSPGLGRWVSRDPIGEVGSVGLYMFLGDPVGEYDVAGLLSECGHRQLRDLISRLDALVRSGRATPCSAFAALMGALYSLNGGNLEAMVKDAVFYAMDPEYVGDTLLAGVPGAYSEDPLGQAWSGPSWLRTHGSQGKSQGYIQLEGDLDDTGRIDHLIANMANQTFRGSLLTDVAQFWTDESSASDRRANELGQELASDLALGELNIFQTGYRSRRSGRDVNNLARLSYPIGRFG